MVDFLFECVYFGLECFDFGGGGLDFFEEAEFLYGLESLGCETLARDEANGGAVIEEAGAPSDFLVGAVEPEFPFGQGRDVVVFRGWGGISCDAPFGEFCADAFGGELASVGFEFAVVAKEIEDCGGVAGDGEEVADVGGGVYGVSVSDEENGYEEEEFCEEEWAGFFGSGVTIGGFFVVVVCFGRGGGHGSYVINLCGNMTNSLHE